MKISATGLYAIMVTMLILTTSFCKTGEEATIEDYTLTVTVADGVSGTPEAGTHTYPENATVPYSYALEPGYSNLTVTLDGAPIDTSGTLTITGNHNLSAGAEVIDIRGKWAGRFEEGPMWGNGQTYLVVFFSGELFSGDTRGHFDYRPDWGNGHFTFDGTNLEFTIEYRDGAFLKLWGSLDDPDHMSGEWDFWSPWGFLPHGFWNMERKPDAPDSIELQTENQQGYYLAPQK